MFEFRGEGGIRTTSNPRFDANSSSLVETGPNSNTFEAKIKIPRQLDGQTNHIGDKYEIRYIDRSTPSGTDEKVIFNGRDWINDFDGSVLSIFIIPKDLFKTTN